MILKLYSYRRHILLNSSDVYCTFPTVRWVLLILLRSASFPNSAGSFISARNSCRSQLSSILNSGKVNLIFLEGKKKKVKKKIKKMSVSCSIRAEWGQLLSQDLNH